MDGLRLETFYLNAVELFDVVESDDSSSLYPLVRHVRLFAFPSKTFRSPRKDKTKRNNKNERETNNQHSPDVREEEMGSAAKGIKRWQEFPSFQKSQKEKRHSSITARISRRRE